MLKVLFVGGTGIISTACARLAVARGMDVTLLNRGQRGKKVEGARVITGNVNAEPEGVRAALGEAQFDVVCNFIVFEPTQIERDLDLFGGRCGQYFFISSASVYQKPLAHYRVTESTPLKNPYWLYSRNKIACEERLLRAYREADFPGIIVRPSYTYDEQLFPLSVGGGMHYTVAHRLLKGKPVVIHGDGASLWSNTHADDFARGFVGLFGNRSAIGEAFHITSDEVLSWLGYYQTLADLLGVTPDFRYAPSTVIGEVDEGQRGSLLGDKAWSAVFDNAKIKRFVPDYRATITFREGMQRTLAWYDAHPEAQLPNAREDQLIEQILARMGT